MADEKESKEGVRKALKRPVEALSWVGEYQGSLKRCSLLKNWPFPTFKGQPLEPVKHPKQPRVNPEWSDALL
jgi:hypothetical protein